jgi:hypothetical protein
MFESPEAFAAIKRPLTVNTVAVVPTLVMFGCAGWLTTSATFALATFPTRFEELIFESPDAFAAIRRPLTVNTVEVVPTLVMFGCAG